MRWSGRHAVFTRLMNAPTLIQIIGATLFGLAVLHTFSTKYFERLAHTQPRHAGIWHLLGEVEVVFGFWAMVLMLFIFGISGKPEAIAYLERSEEHTSELQSLMRISYAVFCLKKKTTTQSIQKHEH